MNDLKINDLKIERILGKKNTQIFKKMMEMNQLKDPIEIKKNYLLLFYLCENEPKYTLLKTQKIKKSPRFSSFVKRSAKLSQSLEIVKRSLVFEIMFLKYYQLILSQLNHLIASQSNKGPSKKSASVYSDRVQELKVEELKVEELKGGTNIHKWFRMCTLIFFLKMATVFSSSEVSIQESQSVIAFDKMKNMEFAEYNQYVTTMTIGVDDTLETVGSLLQSWGLIENKEMKDMVDEFNREYKKQYIIIQKECKHILNESEKANLFDNPDMILQKINKSMETQQQDALITIQEKSHINMQEMMKKRTAEKSISGICKIGSPNVLLTYENGKLGIASPLLFMEGLTNMLLTIKDVNLPMLRKEDAGDLEVTTQLEDELTHKIGRFVEIIDKVVSIQYIGNPLTQSNDMASMNTHLKEFQKDISVMVKYLVANVKEYNDIKKQEAFEYAATVEVMSDLESVKLKKKLDPTIQEIHDTQNELGENELKRVKEENTLLKKQFSVSQEYQDIWVESISRRIFSIPTKLFREVGMILIMGIGLILLSIFGAGLVLNSGSLAFFYVPRLIRWTFGIKQKTPKEIVQAEKKMSNTMVKTHSIKKMTQTIATQTEEDVFFKKASQKLSPDSPRTTRKKSALQKLRNATYKLSNRARKQGMLKELETFFPPPPPPDQTKKQVMPKDLKMLFPPPPPPDFR